MLQGHSKRLRVLRAFCASMAYRLALLSNRPWFRQLLLYRSVRPAGLMQPGGPSPVKIQNSGNNGQRFLSAIGTRVESRVLSKRAVRPDRLGIHVICDNWCKICKISLKHQADPISQLHRVEIARSKLWPRQMTTCSPEPKEERVAPKPLMIDHAHNGCRRTSRGFKTWRICSQNDYESVSRDAGRITRKDVALTYGAAAG